MGSISKESAKDKKAQVNMVAGKNNSESLEVKDGSKGNQSDEKLSNGLKTNGTSTKSNKKLSKKDNKKRRH